jgi:hypothetical protein
VQQQLLVYSINYHPIPAYEVVHFNNHVPVRSNGRVFAAGKKTILHGLRTPTMKRFIVAIKKPGFFV